MQHACTRIACNQGAASLLLLAACSGYRGNLCTLLHLCLAHASHSKLLQLQLCMQAAHNHLPTHSSRWLTYE